MTSQLSQSNNNDIVSLPLTFTLLTTSYKICKYFSLYFQVSYIKAIDSYLIVSFIFVFGVLLEYVAVLMHSEKKRKKAIKRSSTSKDYSLAEMEIEAFNAIKTSVVPRSTSTHSLPPRPPAHSLPARPSSSYSLPPKSVLRNSYPRQVRSEQ